MAVDLARVRELVDQLEVEAGQAAAAKAEMDAAAAEAVAAAELAQTATANFARENDEAKLKMQEIITELQAALSEV